MARTVYIARPRLDCSFKEGPVPEVVGVPTEPVLIKFGEFLDNLEVYHRSVGDSVISHTRPLWQFANDLGGMQARAQENDIVYFPHMLREQFPIGDNALFYKTSPIADYMTIDRLGWGAGMSWLPVPDISPNEHSWRIFDALTARIAGNVSIFDQPPADRAIDARDYLLFVCQIPHDEAIRLYSDVTVAQALAVVLEYGALRGRRVVVKGHPRNRKAMAPFKDLAQAHAALWVDDASIHTCLAGAARVFLVNSGVGFEAMLHNKPVVRFGRAEYAQVVPKAEPNVASLVALEQHRHSLEDYVGFIGAYLGQCVRYDDIGSFGAVIEGAVQPASF